MSSARVPFSLGAAAALALVVGAPTRAAAQIQPTPTQPVGGPDEPKPEGVAEQAPRAPGALPTTPVLPPPSGKKKKFELFEIDGYFRFRTDWFKNFNLNFVDDPVLG